LRDVNNVGRGGEKKGKPRFGSGLVFNIRTHKKRKGGKGRSVLHLGGHMKKVAWRKSRSRSRGKKTTGDYSSLPTTKSEKSEKRKNGLPRLCRRGEKRKKEKSLPIHPDPQEEKCLRKKTPAFRPSSAESSVRPEKKRKECSSTVGSGRSYRKAELGAAEVEPDAFGSTQRGKEKGRYAGLVREKKKRGSLLGGDGGWERRLFPSGEHRKGGRGGGGKHRCCASLTPGEGVKRRRTHLHDALGKRGEREGDVHRRKKT